MKKLICLTAILLIFMGSFLARKAQGEPARTQEVTGRCVMSVPKDWGDYVDSGSYGVVFRDANGTLRFVSQFPCGLDGEPQVSLAIRRK